MVSVYRLNNYYFVLIVVLFQSNSGHSISRSDKVDYSGSRVIRIVPQNLRQLNYLNSLAYNPRMKIWLGPTVLGAPVDVMCNSTDAELLQSRLKALGLNGRVLIHDVEDKIEENKNQVRFFTQLGHENEFFGDYRRYRQIRSYLRGKAKQNQNMTSLISIGKTVEGRPILCMKIGQRIGSSKKPLIYIDGGIHAREWVAISTAIYIIDRLLGDYASGDLRVKRLLRDFDFLIVPVVNPDGYEYTHTTDRMWRKNKATIPGSECMGTDLNRNFDFHWGGEGSSHNPCDETYAGPSALSELESKAIAKLILKNKNRMKAYITLHSYGQYYLYPWGYNSENSPNMKELKRVANIGHSALTAVHGTVYKVGSPGQIMYPAQGSDDWAHGGAKIPYVYCLEMRDLGKHGFLLPNTEIIPVGEETYASVKAVANAIYNTKCQQNICQSSRFRL